MASKKHQMLLTSWEAIRSDQVIFPPGVQAIYGKALPGTFYVMGNISLLERVGVGVCGSRNAGEKMLSFTRDCVKQLAQEGGVIISGYGKGVETTALKRALTVGGAVIIVLSRGIHHFRIRKRIAKVWDWKRVLIISPFPPESPQTVTRLRERNALLVGLSRALLIVGAVDRDGAFHAGKLAIRYEVPLFVAALTGSLRQSSGEGVLMSGGAVPVRRLQQEGKATKTADVSRLVEVLASPAIDMPRGLLL